MNGISPDAVRQLQEDLHSSAAPEFDITEIVRPVLHDTAQDTDILKVPEVFELALPRFKDPFESRPDFKDMWEEFEKRLQEFKDGGASVYEIKDLIGEFGDPELQKKCLEMVQKVEEQKLADPAINPVLDIADMNRLMRHSKVILQLEKDLTEQSVALMRTLQLMEEKKRGSRPPSYEPVYDEFEKMVQQTAKLRNLLEDFKADPSPDKYQELMDLSQDLQEIQQEAAPEIATYNREAEEIRIAHERALEEQKLQIAEFAPQAPEASGPAMTTGGGVGGAF
ncbi:MAG: hypothetical protein LRY62_00025 [Alphaproteobacteria bacterium]|nr:hypothetical protein [Alphaproteobacteria bacterium]